MCFIFGVKDFKDFKDLFIDAHQNKKTNIHLNYHASSPKVARRHWGQKNNYDKEEGACREIRLRDFMIKLYNLVK